MYTLVKAHLDCVTTLGHCEIR